MIKIVLDVSWSCHRCYMDYSIMFQNFRECSSLVKTDFVPNSNHEDSHKMSSCVVFFRHSRYIPPVSPDFGV